METSYPLRLRRRKRTLLPPAVPLALRQLRQTWRLLLFIALAITLTVIIVCMVPLYTQVTESAGLRGTLLATPTSNLITISTSTHEISVTHYHDNDQRYTALFQQNIGPYLAGPVHSEMRIDQILVVPFGQTKSVLVNLVGTPGADVAGHLQLLAGRFPQTTDGGFEVAISQAEANDLALSVGSTLQLNWP